MKHLKYFFHEIVSQTKQDLTEIKEACIEVRQNGWSKLKSLVAEDKHYSLLLLIMLLGAIEFYVYLIVTNGACLNELIFYNPNDPFADMFMDFYNPVRSLFMDNPYTQVKAMYPPIVYLILELFSGTIPKSSIAHDMTSFIGVDYNTLLMARNSREAIFAYVMFSLVNITLLVVMVRFILRNHSKRFSLLFSFLIIFSYPFLYMFDRGQILIVTINSLLFFVLSRESKSKIINELGLASLALAICTKIYPVFFALLLLRERKFGQLLRTGLYTVLLFLIPFAFYGGLDAIIAIFNNVFAVSEDLSNLYPVGNFNILSCVRAFYLLKDWEFDPGVFIQKVLPLFIIVFGSIACLFSKKAWKAMLLVTSIFLMFPNSTMCYNGVYYILPLVEFIKDKDKSKTDYIYVILFSMCFLPIPTVIYDIRTNLGFFDGPNMTVSYVLLAASSCIMTAMLIAEGLYRAIMQLIRYLYHSTERLDVMYFQTIGSFQKHEIFDYIKDRSQLARTNLRNTGIMFLVSYITAFIAFLLNKKGDSFDFIFNITLYSLIPLMIVKTLLWHISKNLDFTEKGLIKLLILGLYVGVRYTAICCIIALTVGSITGAKLLISFSSILSLCGGILMVSLLTVILLLLARNLIKSEKHRLLLCRVLFLLTAGSTLLFILLDAINPDMKWLTGLNPLFYLSTRFWPVIVTEAKINMFSGLHIEFWALAFLAVTACFFTSIIQNYKSLRKENEQKKKRSEVKV